MKKNRTVSFIVPVAARLVGRETVQYVANIATYYIAYSRSEVLLEMNNK